MKLPEVVAAAVLELRHGVQPWDSARWMSADTLRARPLLPLVEAFLTDEAHGPGRLSHLCLAVARRVLPAWSLYCDGRAPYHTLEVLEAYLSTGRISDAAELLSEPAVPSLAGKPIRDCRACDTGSAALAVARALSYALRGDPRDAMECLSAGGAAIDQSPLVAGEDYRRWFTEVAIPAAWQGRALTPDEQRAHRRYDPLDIVPGEGPPPVR